MAGSLDDPQFYLPTHFLTDDVVLHHIDHHSRFHNNGVKSSFAFPAEFPYEYDSSLSSPVESFGFTETDSSSSDEEDFLAGLTRRLAQSASLQQTQKLSVATFSKDKPDWVVSGSPQSTLSGIGSCSSNGSLTGPSSQVPSPPTTPFGAQNDTWDLIYAAAGQVARLKTTIGSELGPTNKFSSSHGRGLLAPPRTPTPGLCPNQSFIRFQHLRRDQVLNKPQQVKLPWSAQQPQQQPQQIQNRGRNLVVGFENGRCGHGASLSQSVWPPLQAQQPQNQHPHPHNANSMRPTLRNSVKRESAGTGVFLPRRYTNPTPDLRKKPGCPTVLLPAKVVQALNLNFEDMNSHALPGFNTGLAPDHEALVARRNALLAQQRRGLRPEQGPLNYEVRLPQEWTY